MHLWTNQDEMDFFKKSLNGFSSAGDLFYSVNSNNVNIYYSGFCSYVENWEDGRYSRGDELWSK
ncbi:MAG: hypothetical protein LBU55_00680 [Elusimicrobiota bacterium]|jgi:hypothetical protein|nr:hypothetical protein [Elusimicrobiota bacterium]